MAAALLQSQRGWRISPKPFVACTGHVVADFFHAGPGHESQLTWSTDQGLAQAAKADVVLFSFGGNDIGFDNVLYGCLPPVIARLAGKWDEVMREVPDPGACDPVDDQPLVSGLKTRIDDLVDNGARSPKVDEDGRMDADGSLVAFYRRVLNETVKDDGVLVVVGYPRLFAPSKDWGDWRGGSCATINAADAGRLGEVAEYLDRRLREATRSADPTGRRIRYVSRLDLFDGSGGGGSHSLCGGRTEWLNRLTGGFSDPEIRFERSFHPNEPGHAATAEVAAEVLEQWAQANAPTTVSATAQARPASSTVPITTGRRFDVGDNFDASCVVAWPTAPVRRRSGTDMRMTCLGVPGQFLFVDVHTDDRDLPITPSTGRVRVIGRIVDVAESELGFRTLVVDARSIVFPR